MNNGVYYRLAKVLDTLPNGFPPTESGVEIRLLEKIFTPEEADLFCDLRLTFEHRNRLPGEQDAP
jgi:electron transport complex protein RnfB